MRADDTKPQGQIVSNSIPSNSRVQNDYPIIAEGSAPVIDTIPRRGRAFTGAPLPPEGSGSGYNGLFRTEDSVAAPNTTTSTISFDGSYNISITDAAQTGLDTFTAMTIEMWYQITTSPDGSIKTILSKLDANGGYEVRVNNPTGAGEVLMQLLLRQSSTKIGTISSSFIVALHHGIGSVYNHFACTYQSTGTGAAIVTAYSNAIPIGTSASTIGTIVDSAANFTIGANATGGSAFTGNVKEVRVWNYERTAAQILVDMRNDNPSGNAPVGYWKLDGNSLDSSGNGNHLTASSPATYGTNMPFGTVYGRTQRYYPVSGGEGFINNGSSSWDNGRSASVGQSVNNSGDYGTAEISRVNFPTVYTFRRYFLPIDTRTLLLPAKGAQLFLNIGDTNVSGGTASALVQTTQASGGTLLTSDFSNFVSLNSPTELAGRLVNIVGTNRWAHFDLNSAGVSAIQYGGTTLLGVRQGRDVDNGTLTSASVIQANFEMSYVGGTMTGPFLDVIV